VLSIRSIDVQTPPPGFAASAGLQGARARRGVASVGDWSALTTATTRPTGARGAYAGTALAAAAHTNIAFSNKLRPLSPTELRTG
jgi:hypothetical protein